MHPSFLGETLGRLARLVAFVVPFAFLLVLVAPGCGRTSLEPESLRDGGTATSSCGPSTCPDGCCDASGVCRTGSDVRACGSVGGRCSDCVANGFSLCTESGVCGREDPSCSPSTCTGCCSIDAGRRRCLSGTEPAGCGSKGSQCANCAVEGRACDLSTRACGTTRCDASNCDGCCVGDKCLVGDTTSACGNGGAECSTCATGQACRPAGGGGGQCQGSSSCGPDNCNGCCNAAGQCVAGNDTTACGRQGLACAACGTNEICARDGQPNARTCQPLAPCGPATCDGCCVGNQCVETGTGSACGIKGVACKQCGSTESCNAVGQCVPDTADCNPGNCAGCCIGDICAVGTQSTACGVAGQQCLNCASQAPPRVCTSGSCQVANCGPLTCPNGCCSGNTCVTGTQDNACGAVGGLACKDCTGANQVCEGRVCAAKCGPANCTGCCQANNVCSPTGLANNACGAGGVACANCSATGSYCNGLVEPRRCNNQQNTCPAPYGNCALGINTPITPPTQRLCTDAQLGTLATACAGGPDTAACISAVALLGAACRTCLGPFNQPFEQSIGLYACAASFVDPPCRRQTGCATNCVTTSCNQCSSTSENQCHSLVSGIGGQCRMFFNGANCATAALSAGQLCSQFSYANFGQWLRGVGDHFCGNGP